MNRILIECELHAMLCFCHPFCNSSRVTYPIPKLGKKIKWGIILQKNVL